MPNKAGDSWSQDDERRVLSLVDQVLDLPEEAREAFLSEECAGNAALRDAVDALIAACLRVERGDAFLSIRDRILRPALVAVASGATGGRRAGRHV